MYLYTLRYHILCACVRACVCVCVSVCEGTRMCVCERERVTGVIDRPLECKCGCGCVSHRYTSMGWQQRVFSLNCFVFYEKGALHLWGSFVKRDLAIQRAIFVGLFFTRDIAVEGAYPSLLTRTSNYLTQKFVCVSVGVGGTQTVRSTVEVPKTTYSPSLPPSPCTPHTHTHTQKRVPERCWETSRGRN